VFEVQLGFKIDSQNTASTFLYSSCVLTNYSNTDATYRLYFIDKTVVCLVAFTLEV